MFNFKKIGIILSVLALVGLTGALMAGPAFAKPKGDDGDHKMMKTNVCHYQEEVDKVMSLDGVTVMVKHEDEGWANINIDNRALKAHVGDEFGRVAHNDVSVRDSGSDFIINDGRNDFLTDGNGELLLDVNDMPMLDTSNDTSECDTRVELWPEVDHAH